MSWTSEHVQEAGLPATAVFRLYADPSTWPLWGHSVRWARADGALSEGSIVRVKAAYGAVYPCRVLRLVPDRLLELEVRPPGLRIVNGYEVTPMDAGVQVRHAFDVSGPLSGPARVLAGAYRRQLGDEVSAVIRLAATGGSRP